MTDLFIQTLGQMKPDFVWLGLLLFCLLSVLAASKFFGSKGLIAFMGVAIVVANIQVLKTVKFGFFDHPVALGTAVFASIYLCTDILTECYGKAVARSGVLISFFCFLCFTVLMQLTIGISSDLGSAEMGPVQQALEAMMMPIPRLFVAGMAAYLVSQMFDIWLFDALRKKTSGRHLWLRNTLSTVVASLIDNAVFSVLAWVVLAPVAMEWETLVYTYILGTWFLRIFIAVLDTPFIYLAVKFARKEPKEVI
jgi:uncharacterized integral membrane protein (TIGR00697 family)